MASQLLSICKQVGKSSANFSTLSMKDSDVVNSSNRTVAMYKGLKVAVYTMDKTEIYLTRTDLIELVNVCSLLLIYCLLCLIVRYPICILIADFVLAQLFISYVHAIHRQKHLVAAAHKCRKNQLTKTVALHLRAQWYLTRSQNLPASSVKIVKKNLVCSWTRTYDFCQTSSLIRCQFVRTQFSIRPFRPYPMHSRPTFKIISHQVKLLVQTPFPHSPCPSVVRPSPF